MYARGRPHRRHRLRSRILYFGAFVSFAIFAVVAMCPLGRPERLRYEALNGMPSSWSSLRDSSSVFAVVTTEMFIPRALSTFM